MPTCIIFTDITIDHSLNLSFKKNYGLTLQEKQEARIQVIAQDLDQAQSVAEALQQMLNQREKMLQNEIGAADMSNQMIGKVTIVTSVRVCFSTLLRVFFCVRMCVFAVCMCVMCIFFHYLYSIFPSLYLCSCLCLKACHLFHCLLYLFSCQLF